MHEETSATPSAPEQDAEATTSAAGERKKESAKPAPDPTRYGDWEVRGRCIDF